MPASAVAAPGGETTQSDADDQSDDQAQERELERGRPVAGQDGGDRLVVGERGAQIAAQQPAKIVEVLHDQRTVIAGGMDTALQLFGSQASAQGGGNRVAGGTHHEKHDGDENEYSGDDQQESGQYETEKPTGQTVFLGFRLRLRRCRRRGAFGHAMLLLGKTIEYG